MEQYRWRGRKYLLLKDVVETYGPSVRAKWISVPEEHKLVLTGEAKESFCESNGLDHRSHRIALLQDTDRAWYSLLGIPRTTEAIALCSELKNASFDFFWFGKRGRDLEDRLQEMEKEKDQKIKRLQKLIQKAKALRKKSE